LIIMADSEAVISSVAQRQLNLAANALLPS
jgi:hypothetical protein